MKKQILSIIVMLCMAFCFIPAAAYADTSGENVITIDVGGANADNENYKIDDTQIILRVKDTVTYELTGTTDKKISIWGSNNAEDIDKAFYIRANNVSVGGGIVVQNSPVKMVLEVPEGTDNSIDTVTANDLTISGSGTLRAMTLNVTQKTSYMPSALQIRDTNIIVNNPVKRSGEWNGPCVLSGDATVKYISSGDYAALQVGVKSGDLTHSLTLKDNAKLYCLHAEPEKASDYSVSGLEIFQGAPLTMEGNSYLEAQGRPTTGKYAGYGIVTEGKVKIKDNASVKASATDVALCASGDIDISGGTVDADSTSSNGIYTDGKLTISNGAKVKAAGYYPGIYAATGISISGSQVKAVSSGDVALFTRKDMTIENSKIKAEAAEDYDGIRGNGTMTVSGSWIETSGSEAFDDDITNSVLFNGKSGKVIGNAVLPGDAKVSEGMNLLIPEGTSLIVGAGKTFENNGIVTLKGSFAADGGTVICTSHSGGKATCVKKAECDVCQAEYGEVDPKNHANLRHFDAKAATSTAEGNIEYWYCESCGKYYSDAAAGKEISKADITTAKLTAAEKSAQTGDDSNMLAWLLLLLASGGAAAALVSRKRRCGR